MVNYLRLHLQQGLVCQNKFKVAVYIKFAIFRIETINMRPPFDNENCVNSKLHQLSI